MKVNVQERMEYEERCLIICSRSTSKEIILSTQPISNSQKQETEALFCENPYF